MKSPAVFLQILAALALTMMFAGCAASPVNSRAAWEPNRKTRGTVTPFWIQFPPKAKGFFIIPNQTLPQNTPVRMIGKRRGFVHVQLENLEMGWMPRGTLKGN
jgi:hypothetical protein